jgi:hypothetical protein
VEFQGESDAEADESETDNDNCKDGNDGADVNMDSLEETQSDVEVIQSGQEGTDEANNPDQLAIKELSPQASDMALDCLQKCIAIANAASQKDMLGELQKRLASAMKHKQIAFSEMTLHLRTLSIKRRQEDDEERKRKREEELKVEKDVAKTKLQTQEAKHMAARARVEELKARSTEREELLRLEQDKKRAAAEQQQLQQHSATVVAKYLLKWWKTRSSDDRISVREKVQRVRAECKGSAYCEVPEFFTPMSRQRQ